MSDDLADRMAAQIQRQNAIKAARAAEAKPDLVLPIKVALEKAEQTRQPSEEEIQERAERRDAFMRHEAERKRTARLDWLYGIGCPKVVVQAASSPEQTEALEALRDEMNAGATITILSGGVGVGKSVASADWLLRQWDQFGFCDAAWLHAHQLSRLASFEQHEEQGAIERVNFLVLDDIGIEYLDGKGFLSAMLDSIIYQRHGNRRPTVITTNLAAPDFKARYGERVADRVRECGSFVQVAGKSRRSKGDRVHG